MIFSAFFSVGKVLVKNCEESYTKTFVPQANRHGVKSINTKTSGPILSAKFIVPPAIPLNLRHLNLILRNSRLIVYVIMYVSSIKQFIQRVLASKIYLFCRICLYKCRHSFCFRK